MTLADVILAPLEEAMREAEAQLTAAIRNAEVRSAVSTALTDMAVEAQARSREAIDACAPLMEAFRVAAEAYTRARAQASMRGQLVQ